MPAAMLNASNHRLRPARGEDLRLFLPDLGLAGGLAVWALRSVCRGPDADPALNRVFDTMLGRDAAPALDALRSLGRSLAARDAARLAEPGALWTTTDEAAVIRALRAAEYGDERGSAIAMAEAFDGRPSAPALFQLETAARAFREHGLSVMDDYGPDHPGLPGGRQAA